MEQPQEATMNAAPPLLCVRCEYDVTSIAPEGVCPECGLEREKSVLGDSLASAPTEYRQTLIDAATCLSWAFGVLTVSAMILAMSEANARDPFALSLFGFVLGSILAAFGTLGLATPDPRPSIVERRLTLRKLCWLSALAPVSALASGWYMFGPPFFGVWHVGTLGVILYWGVIVGLIAWPLVLLSHTAQLCRAVATRALSRAVQGCMVAFALWIATASFAPETAVALCFVVPASITLIFVVLRSRLIAFTDRHADRPAVSNSAEQGTANDQSSDRSTVISPTSPETNHDR
jgi:hypothetical protein